LNRILDPNLITRSDAISLYILLVVSILFNLFFNNYIKQIDKFNIRFNIFLEFNLFKIFKQILFLNKKVYTIVNFNNLFINYKKERKNINNYNNINIICNFRALLITCKQ